MMPRNWRRSVALLAVLGLGCGGPAPADKPVVVASIPPVAMILRPILGHVADVHVLAPAGASPHTYAPRPADARAAAEAAVVVYVADDLDGWATELEAERTLPLLSLVPPKKRLPYVETHEHDGHTHHHHSVDPHFWLDPTLVAEVIPALVEQLKAAGIEVVDSNASYFGEVVAGLDAALEEELAPIKGIAIAQFHPSMNYFFHRYGIENAGYVELSPGKEASPKYLHELAERLKTEGAAAVATEPQLPEGPARAVAEAAGILLTTVDPLGGVPGRMKYVELLEFNADYLLPVKR